jgi:2-phosphosulfolactate phosphatase
VSGDWKDATLVVIDVLRATSTIVTALMNGCESVVPVAEVEEAFHLAKGPLAGALIGGEREGVAVAGFDFGNSPLEYTSARVKGRTIILTTTNGSRTFRSIPEDRMAIAASFLNTGAVARHSLEQGRDVLFLPSGMEGGFSLEDTVCAGAIVELIRNQFHGGTELTEAALASEALYKHFQGDLVEMFQRTVQGQCVIETDAEPDLAYCAQTDVTSIVPAYREGRIGLREEL